MTSLMSYLLVKLMNILVTFAVALLFYCLLQIIRCYITRAFKDEFKTYCILASTILATILVGLFL